MQFVPCGGGGAAGSEEVMNRVLRSALLATLLAGVLVAGPVRADVLGDLARATVAVTAVTDRGNYVGTGVVVHKSGYVLTSTTVVPPDAKEVRVRFLSGPEVRGELVATDARMELAVVKVPRMPAGTRAVAIRRSAGVHVGEPAFSYGDAFTTFGDSGTFTASLGIVSGTYELTRQISPPGNMPVYVGRVLETTATLAPGMDGGPLLDGSGRLIGLLSLNVSEARWLGVAVPSDTLLGPLEKAIETHSRAAGKPVRLTVVDTAGPPAFPQQQRRAEAFAKAADAIAGSVVAIEAVRHPTKPVETAPATRRGRRGRPELPRTDPDELTGPYAGILQRPDAPATGLIVSADGEILTSHFNVAGNIKSLHVVLPDGRRLPARRLGWDAFRDLAMLKVDAKDLPAATLAEEPTPVGAAVAALGRSPDPASLTMTTGIVSAADRFDGTAIQIDARTNYGNTGGPLIDEKGRCVGVVAHVSTDGMWSQNSGVGFAIPTRSIRQVLDRLRAGEVIAKPQRGYLGVRTGSAGLDAGGVRVEAVMPDTGAQRAGLRAGDVITHVDAEPVGEPADLTRLILRRAPGAEVSLTIRRGESVQKIQATLGVHPYQ